jgi:predicted nucleic acid-binding protein
LTKSVRPEKNSGRKNLLLILDSNEYILALGAERDRLCEELLEKIAERSDAISLRIPRLIVEEIRNNLTPETFKEFIICINKLTRVDEDIEIPFELGAKYESLGFKPADAFIAAYAEWTGADALVTENRHFITRHSGLPFRILRAVDCLKLLNK